MRESIFPETHFGSSKNVGKNIVAKKRKYVFYIHTNIVTKIWGEKKSETIFPETHEWFGQKCWEKNRRKKERKNVFYIHTNIVTKNRGK